MLVNYKLQRNSETALLRYSSISLYLSVLQDSVVHKALSARLFALLLLVRKIHFREYGKGITSEKYQTIDRRQERIERDVHAITSIHECLQLGEIVKYEDIASKYRGSKIAISRKIPRISIN